MIYAAPEIPLIENAINLDKYIQGLQVGLGQQCPWLDYAFGRAITGRQLNEATQREQTFPLINKPATTEYFDLGPNSHYGSHAFFQLNGPARAVDFAAFMPNLYRAELALICLYNIDLVAARMGVEPDEINGGILQQSLLDALMRGGIDDVLRIDDTPTEVFRGYTYNHLQHQTFMHPEGGIKIAFSAHYMQLPAACA